MSFVHYLGHILQSFGENFSYVDAKKEETCVVIDDMSIVQSIGKPNNPKTFGGYARIFCNVIFRILRRFLELTWFLIIILKIL